MNLLLNQEIDKEQWRLLLQKSEFASPFQTPEFWQFFNSVDGFNADVFALEQNNSLTALVCVTRQKEKGLKGFFSRRAIVYGGPLISTDSPEKVSALLKVVIDHYRSKAIYMEIRNYFDYSLLANQFEQVGFRYISWLNFQLTTDTAESVKKKMSRARQTEVKKAIKNGAYWREAKSENEIKSFYSILKELYQTKIKKPLLPEVFFLEFYRQNMGKYLLVFSKNKVIGGTLCPVMPQKAIYLFYLCGLHHNYKDLYPSVMATWAVIEYAMQHSIPVFDFMGAGSPGEPYGVRKFKAQFGGTQVEHGRFIKVLNPVLYKIGKAGLYMLSKIKL